MDDTAPDFECMFEMYFERRVPGIFREWLLRARPVYHDELPGIDEARDAGTLSEQEMAQVAALDIILYGRFRDSREQGYLAVEISRTVNPDDVERASERAAILRKAGLPARAAVGGRRITAEAEKFARDDGVIVAILRTEPA